MVSHAAPALAWRDRLEDVLHDVAGVTGWTKERLFAAFLRDFWADRLGPDPLSVSVAELIELADPEEALPVSLDRESIGPDTAMSVLGTLRSPLAQQFAGAGYLGRDAKGRCRDESPLDREALKRLRWEKYDKVAQSLFRLAEPSSTAIERFIRRPKLRRWRSELLHSLQEEGPLPAPKRQRGRRKGDTPYKESDPPIVESIIADRRAGKEPTLLSAIRTQAARLGLKDNMAVAFERRMYRKVDAVSDIKSR